MRLNNVTKYGVNCQWKKQHFSCTNKLYAIGFIESMFVAPFDLLFVLNHVTINSIYPGCFV